MRRARHFALQIALAALVGFTLYGCSQLPTAPRDAELASATISKPRPASAPAAVVPAVDVLNLTGLIVRTTEIVGSVGGSVANGRWSVVVPAGAVEGNATVALAIASPTSSDCRLEILPVDLNNFGVPAMLTVDCRSVPVYRLATFVIYWHDPSSGAWIPVKGSKVDLVARTVTAPLQHFSQYSVDTKAGW